MLNLFQRQFVSFMCVLLNDCKIYYYKELFKETQTLKHTRCYLSMSFFYFILLLVLLIN